MRDVGAESKRGLVALFVQRRPRINLLRSDFHQPRQEGSCLIAFIFHISVNRYLILFSTSLDLSSRESHQSISHPLIRALDLYSVSPDITITC